MRWLAALGLVLASSLAGCSGAEGDLDPGADDLAVNSGAVDTAAPTNGTVAEPITDTLWLTPEARLDTTASSNLTILATLSGAFPQSFGWNATLNGTGNLSAARLVLWIDLQNSALQSGIGGDPGCSAAMTVTFTINGTALVQPGGCASIGMGAVPPGEHRLEFSTLLTSRPEGVLIAPGDGVRVQVDFGLSLPQGVGHLLGGGDHDSGLRLAGLAEPVPASPPPSDGPATPRPR